MRDENKTNSSDCNAECRICNMHYRNIYTHGVNGFYKKPSVSIMKIILDKNFAQMKEEEEETADTEENPEDSQETEEKTSEAEPTTEEEPEENVEI